MGFFPALDYLGQATPIPILEPQVEKTLWKFHVVSGLSELATTATEIAVIQLDRKAPNRMCR